MSLLGLDPVANFNFLIGGFVLARIEFDLSHSESLRGPPLNVINRLTIVGGSLAAFAGSFSLPAMIGALFFNVVFHGAPNFIQDYLNTFRRSPEERAAHEVAHAFLLAEKGREDLAARAINEIFNGSALNLGLTDFGGKDGMAVLKGLARPGETTPPFGKRFIEALHGEMALLFPEGLSVSKARGLVQRVDLAERWNSAGGLENVLKGEAAYGETPLISVAVDASLGDQLEDVVRAIRGRVGEGSRVLFL